MAPRKVRLVAGLIRNKSVSDAKGQLKFSDKKSASSLLKLLCSAEANARNNFNIDDKNLLYIKEIKVNEGPHSLKRWMPRAMGRAYPILKRISHIDLVLEAKGVELKKDGKKSDIRSIKTNIAPKILKEESKNVSNELKGRLEKEKVANDENVDKGYVADKPYDASGVSKNKNVSRQWRGNLGKKFFRRKSV